MTYGITLNLEVEEAEKYHAILNSQTTRTYKDLTLDQLSTEVGLSKTLLRVYLCRGEFTNHVTLYLKEKVRYIKGLTIPDIAYMRYLASRRQKNAIIK